MVSTLLVIGGVLVGLLALLALIVRLSARPATTSRRTEAAPSTAGAAGRSDPDASSEPTPTSEMPAVR